LSACGGIIDTRRADIKGRLEQFEVEYLRRFLDYGGVICYDTYNYDESTGGYCPIAIILGIPRIIKSLKLRPSYRVVLKVEMLR
jgi:hypothetical protein